jgi:hypothetical protein
LAITYFDSVLLWSPFLFLRLLFLHATATGQKVNIRAIALITSEKIHVAAEFSGLHFHSGGRFESPFYCTFKINFDDENLFGLGFPSSFFSRSLCHVQL